MSPSGDMPITPIFFEDRSIPDSAVLSVISPFEPQSELERLQHWLNSRLEPFLGLAITDEAGAAIGRTVRFCIGAYLRHNVLPSHWYEVLGHVNVILSDDEEDASTLHISLVDPNGLPLALALSVEKGKWN